MYQKILILGLILIHSSMAAIATEKPSSFYFGFPEDLQTSVYGKWLSTVEHIRFNTAITNKQSRHAIQGLQVYIEYFKTFHNSSFVGECSNARKKRITAFQKGMELIHQSQHLQELELLGCCRQSALNDIPQNWKNLKKIKLSYMTIKDFNFPKLRLLKELILIDCEIEKVLTLKQQMILDQEVGFSRSTSRKRVDTDIRAEKWFMIAESSPNLQMLRVDQNCTFYCSALASFFRHCKELTKIHLSGCFTPLWFKNRDIWTQDLVLPSLESLIVYGFVWWDCFDDDGGVHPFSAFISLLPNLRSLDLEVGAMIRILHNDDMIQALIALPKLEAIELNDGLSEYNLRNLSNVSPIVRLMPNLKKLTVPKKRLSAETESLLSDAARLYPHLTLLIEGDYYLTY